MNLQGSSNVVANEFFEEITDQEVIYTSMYVKLYTFHHLLPIIATSCL